MRALAWLAALIRGALNLHHWEYSDGLNGVPQYRKCLKCGRYEWAREDDWGTYWEVIATGSPECTQ